MAKHHVRSQRNRDHRFTRFSFLLIFLTILFSSSAFGFYAPLTNYTASYNGSLIKLSVYDPYRGTTVESDWLDYLTDFRQSNGVASWLSASDEMTVAVYDPARSTPWRIGTRSNVLAPGYHTNDHGHAAIYAIPNGSPSVVISKYSPENGSWDFPGLVTGSLVDLTIYIRDQLMIIYYIDYEQDPYHLDAYALDERNGARTKIITPFVSPISDLSVDEVGNITYVDPDNETNYMAYHFDRYIGPDTYGEWRGPSTTEVFKTKAMACIVEEQTVSGSPSPENVWWFFDCSIGSTSSSIDFKDGFATTQRAPGHPFTTNSTFRVEQTVCNTFNCDCHYTDITNTIVAPTGSITIADLHPTYDRDVNLSFTYSGEVDLMRLKNENNSLWGSWFYATPVYNCWQLSAGYGTKTVSAQFFDDDLDKISQEYTAQIDYVAPIAVTSPNGGEYLKQGNTYYVTWTYPGPNAVKVELWNNGSFQATLASAISPGTTSIMCTIPVNHNEASTWFGSNYKIRVTDVIFNNYDESDGNFHIGDIWMTAPNGSESIVLGTSYSIQFTAREIPSDPIKITLWDNDVKIGAIADNITITNPENSISWTLVGDLIDGSGCTGINEEITSLGANFKIQARAGTTEFKDSSDSNFTINGIRVSAPNGDYCNSGEIVNQILIYGNQYSISWDALSLPTGDIKITLMQGTTTLGVIATDLPNTQTSYNWTVGKDLNGNDFTPSTGTGFKVRVRVKDQAVIDESDNSFEIQNP